MADMTAGLDPCYVNRRAQLPYGVAVRQIEEAVARTYRLVHGINGFLLENGFRHLEELILANSFSGLISEFLVKNIAGALWPTRRSAVTLTSFRQANMSRRRS